MSTDQTTESLILAKGADVAPRVTPADIERTIFSEYYFSAADGIDGASMRTLRQRAGEVPRPLEMLTFCVLTLENGFNVTGQSACASPENFNAEIGRKVARENAVDKIWPLLGYELRTRLHEAAIKDARVRRIEG